MNAFSRKSRTVTKWTEKNQIKLTWDL